uniref:C3H1-type domain-containing protein n=1 Tax=Strigamia maritima TaxID=126957 RepID=T1J519_STRMM
MDKIESDEERSIDKILHSPDGKSMNSSDKYDDDETNPLSENTEGAGEDNLRLQVETELHVEKKETDKSQDDIKNTHDKNNEAVDDEKLLEKISDAFSESISKPAELKVEPKKNVERVKKEISKNVEDQEAELDFEEEVNEERKDESEMEEKLTVDKENIKRNEREEVKEKFIDGDDDGELEDDEDLEEGEVKDTSVRKVPNKPICRFFNKGQCTWGSACRFIHPGVNDRGNYNMFSSSKPLVPSNNLGIGGGMMPGPPGRGHSGWRDVMIPPIPADDAPPVESAWERGLRHAKEILKKANRRKEMEPDFEEKRLNLSLGASECSPEFEKENDFYCKSPYKKTADPVFTYGYDDPDPLDRQAQEYWRGGNYENFEVRYLRNDYDYRTEGKEKDKDKDRSRRDKFDKARLQDHNWRDNRFAEVQVNTRGRDDEWKDPWRRSTSPKRGGRSKSYSSASSASSCTSGFYVSGQPIHLIPHIADHRQHLHLPANQGSVYPLSLHHSFNQNRLRPRSQSRKNRTTAPNSGSTSNITPSSKKKPAQFPAQAPPKPSRLVDKKAPSPPPPLMPQISVEKKKKSSDKQTVPPASSKSKRPRSPSSGSSTSRSRSRNSSKGSISSHSSSRSSSVSSISDYDRKANGVNKKQEKVVKIKDKTKAKSRNVSKKYSEDRSANEHERKTGQPFDSRVKSAVSSTRGSKDPLKQSGLKPQIKLTLLNKQQPDKASSVIPKKENTNVVKAKPAAQEKESKFSMKIPMSASKAKALALSKPDLKAFGEKNMDDSPPDSEPEDLIIKQPQQPMLIVSTGGISTTINTVTTSISGKKRPATPPTPPKQNMPVPHKITPTLTVGNKANVAASLKKNTVSRREELLKQLKAVEDAIARKRAKLS